MINSAEVVANFTNAERRLRVPLLLMILGAFGLAGIFVYRISYKTSNATRVQIERSVTAALQEQQLNLERTIYDYAAWGDAYRNLHAAFNPTWAYEEKNLGPTLFPQFSIDSLFVVAPDGANIYKVIDGLLSNSLDVNLQGGLDEMVESARSVPGNETHVVSGFMVEDGDLVLAAAAAFSTGGDPSVAPVPGAPSILVFANRLTSQDLAALGRRSLASNLSVPSSAPNDNGVTQTELATFNGHLHAVLRWDLPPSGHAFLGETLAYLGIAALGWAALTMLVIRACLHGTI